MTCGRFEVIYRIKADNKNASETAKIICYEQTVELDEELVSDKFIKENITGEITDFKKTGDDIYEAAISYPAETSSFELPQFLNVLFGNTSIKKNIKAVDFSLSPQLAERFKGPKFGIGGLRNITGVNEKPMLAAALKPMGKPAKELAYIAYSFALGGIDIVKDDHGLADQKFCPFNERVKACSEAVEKANLKTGRKTIYVPNITAPCDEICERAAFARKWGAKGVMISPGLTGFDIIRSLSENRDFNIPVITHPALLGSYLINNDSGFSHSLLLGKLQRMSGADAVIFPGFDGRFGFTKEECLEIASSYRNGFHGLKPALPMAGGGLKKNNISQTAGLYGNDVIFLVGGSLYAESGNLTENVKTFLRLIKRI